ncbi:MAG: B12-binding domain-containing radical SAM protein [Acetobacteraceae bacterium]|nr:B12-binding domain-containing radical SAM protein [Acetobacteraceae bacterium]
MTPHLGLAHLAASLRVRGHAVKLIEAAAVSQDNAGLAALVQGSDPLLIGITCTYDNYGLAIDLAKRLKAALPRTRICMGGHHVSFVPTEALSQEASVDFILRGEAELSLPALVDSLQGRRPIQEVAGLAYRQDHAVRLNEPAPAPALDAIPAPALDTYEVCVDRGVAALATAHASRGCHMSCSFCDCMAFGRLHGRSIRWRPRPPNLVVQDLLNLRRVLGETGPVYFTDENFLGPGQAGLKHASAVGAAIAELQPPLQFHVSFRADAVNRHSLPVIAALRRAGLRSVFLGLESGSQRILDRLGKRLSVRQGLAALGALRRLGVAVPEVGFIMFTPDSTPRDLLANAALLRRTGHLTWSRLTQRLELFPGTQLSQEVMGGRDPGPGGWGYCYSLQHPVVGRMASGLAAIEDRVGGLRRAEGWLARIELWISNGSCGAGLRRRLSSFRRRVLRLTYDAFVGSLRMAAMGQDPSHPLLEASHRVAKWCEELELILADVASPGRETA